MKAKRKNLRSETTHKRAMRPFEVDYVREAAQKTHNLIGELIMRIERDGYGSLAHPRTSRALTMALDHTVTVLGLVDRVR